MSLSGLFDEVHLYLLVAGHTKNVCDGSLGNFKKRFRARNVYTPLDMMHIVKEYAANCLPVYASQVKWQESKGILGKHFKYPADVKTTQNHIFTFTQHSPDFIQTKEFTSSTVSNTFYLLQCQDAAEITPIIINDIKGDSFLSSWPSLEDTPSARQGNRAAYLQKNVLYKYFFNDCIMRTLYSCLY